MNRSFPKVKMGKVLGDYSMCGSLTTLGMVITGQWLETNLERWAVVG